MECYQIIIIIILFLVVVIIIIINIIIVIIIKSTPHLSNTELLRKTTQRTLWIN